MENPTIQTSVPRTGEPLKDTLNIAPAANNDIVVKPTFSYVPPPSDSESEHSSDDEIYDDCSTVRRRITQFLATKEMTLTEFIKAIGLSGTGPYYRFMKAKGKYGGSDNSTYFKAYHFFEHRNKDKPKSASRKKKEKERKEYRELEKKREEQYIAAMQKAAKEREANPIENLLHKYDIKRPSQAKFAQAFARCNEQTYAQLGFDKLKLTPMEKLLATVDLSALDLVLNDPFNDPVTLPTSYKSAKAGINRWAEKEFKYETHKKLILLVKEVREKVSSGLAAA